MIEFKEHLETDEILTYKGKWKNLHFTKNGKSSLSQKQSFDSKELAENGMREWIAENEQVGMSVLEKTGTIHSPMYFTGRLNTATQSKSLLAVSDGSGDTDRTCTNEFKV